MYDNSGNSITLTVTSPSFNKISNYGRMTFTTEDYSAGNMSVKNSGSITLVLGNISVRPSGGTFRISNYGVAAVNAGKMELDGLDINNSGSITVEAAGVDASDVNIENYGRMTYSGNIKAGDVEYKNSGSCTLKAGFNVAGKYDYVNYGVSELDGDVTAGHAVFSNSGKSDVRTQVKAGTLDISVTGVSTDSIGFSGDSLRIDCSGSGRLDMQLDCRSVEAEANGVIELKLSGTADNTRFTGSGRSKINTSGLNKF